MEDRSFRTIQRTSEGFYKEKGSKFLAFAFPANNLEEVKGHLESLRKQYHDARHHCYAYIIDTDSNQLIRANDDGEPNHSAGDPILGQIKSKELTNTLIVVVRYFGGTKLGVSGLIQAYRTASEDALTHNEIITIKIKKDLSIEFDYEATSEVMRCIQQFGVEIKDQEYDAKCTIYASILPSKFQSFKDKLALIRGVQMKG